MQPVSHHVLREWVFEPKNLDKLRREGAEKFLRWREREQKVEAYVPTPTHGRFPSFSGALHTGQVLPISPEAFERFTFDLLFSESDFGDTDEEAGTHYTDVEDTTPQEEEPLAKGYFQEDRTWETDLSRMVALRKRHELSRMDTIRGSHVRQPLPSILPVSPPDVVDTEFESSAPYSGNESDEFASASDMVDMDPLYFPSLLSIVRSIIPELRSRLVARIRWVFPGSGPYKLPTHADDLDQRIRMAGGSGVSLPMVGVLCAVAATAGFWAGIAVRTEVFIRL